jgi:hypothetical protein
VIGSLYPPRVASEEKAAAGEGRGALSIPEVRPVLERYGSGPELLAACRSREEAFVVRPLPHDEGAACLEAVTACLEGGRSGCSPGATGW